MVFLQHAAAHEWTRGSERKLMDDPGLRLHCVRRFGSLTGAFFTFYRHIATYPATQARAGSALLLHAYPFGFCLRSIRGGRRRGASAEKKDGRAARDELTEFLHWVYP